MSGVATQLFEEFGSSEVRSRRGRCFTQVEFKLKYISRFLTLLTRQRLSNQQAINFTALQDLLNPILETAGVSARSNHVNSGSDELLATVLPEEGDFSINMDDTHRRNPPDRSILDNARKHLLEEGWAVIPNVLSPDESKNVLSRLWQAKEVSEARGDQTRMAHLDPNESNIRVFYLMELDKIFRELISHPVAIEMVKAVLGDNFLISNFTANIARPGSQPMALHSDQSIVMPDPWKQTWAINCIWCLTDVYKENGATMFIPGSNKWVFREDIPQDAPKLLKPFEAPAGSIILMDGRV